MEKKVSILFSSVLMVCAAASIVYSFSSAFDPFFLLIGGVLMAISVFVIHNNFKPQISREEQTYEWYKSTYPHSVQGNLVTCFTCENNSIDSKSFEHKTFQREIFCKQCGQTLYYTE